jgi:hypothetical protein
MWASPALTRRCKLLMFAVIARGLGCAVCEAEAVRSLQDEGLTEPVLARVLTHLDAPELVRPAGARRSGAAAHRP